MANKDETIEKAYPTLNTNNTKEQEQAKNTEDNKALDSKDKDRRNRQKHNFKTPKPSEAKELRGLISESKPVPLKEAPAIPRDKAHFRPKKVDISTLDDVSNDKVIIEIPKDLKKPLKGEVFYATGRRKTSSARVFLQGGEGVASINGSTVEEYFPYKRVQEEALQPIKRLEAENIFNLKITVKGGGVEGQAGAIRHGLARALLKYDESLKQFLRKSGYLTRDSRSVERKKVGLHKARKSPQYSKR